MSILLATRDTELISRCRRAVSAEHPLEAVDSVANLLSRTRSALPAVILLDADILDTPIDRQASEIVAATSGTRVIVMTAAFNEDEEIALLKAGVKGCCRRSVDAESLEQVLNVTSGGGVWVTRSLLPRLVSELRRYAEGQRPAQAADKSVVPDKLSALTRREKEIVQLIAGGASNKQVASALDISERTVKGHLSNVFQKLGVSDRLRLVLYVTDGKPAAAAVRK
jgi:two-component system nitrate/nitrite response regulator NarL